MSKSNKLVFFGTEDFSAKSLEALIEAGFNIVAVITKPDSKVGRGQKSMPPKVKKIAEKNNLRLFQPDKLANIASDIKNLEPSHGVLVAYGKIIPQSFIDIFPGGIINLHPSELPRYRGPAPIEAVIINGDKDTAISLMKLTAAMDAGPVYLQKKVALAGNETRPELYEKLATLGATLLASNLSAIISGSLKPTDQDNSKATYTKLLTKEAGLIDWSKPADILEREVRAYLGYPRSATELFGHKVIVTKARVAQSTDDGQLVRPCNNSYLEIQELIGPSGKTMSGADFIRGYAR